MKLLFLAGVGCPSRVTADPQLVPGWGGLVPVSRTQLACSAMVLGGPGVPPVVSSWCGALGLCSSAPEPEDWMVDCSLMVLAHLQTVLPWPGAEQPPSLCAGVLALPSCVSG